MDNGKLKKLSRVVPLKAIVIEFLLANPNVPDRRPPITRRSCRLLARNIGGILLEESIANLRPPRPVIRAKRRPTCRDTLFTPILLKSTLSPFILIPERLRTLPTRASKLRFDARTIPENLPRLLASTRLGLLVSTLDKSNTSPSGACSLRDTPVRNLDPHPESKSSRPVPLLSLLPVVRSLLDPTLVLSECLLSRLPTTCNLLDRSRTLLDRVRSLLDRDRSLLVRVRSLLARVRDLVNKCLTLTSFETPATVTFNALTIPLRSPTRVLANGCKSVNLIIVMVLLPSTMGVTTTSPGSILFKLADRIPQLLGILRRNTAPPLSIARFVTFLLVKKKLSFVLLVLLVQVVRPPHIGPSLSLLPMQKILRPVLVVGVSSETKLLVKPVTAIRRSQTSINVVDRSRT